MRLLLLTQDFPPKTGGIETYCFELAKRWNKSLSFFQVVAPSHKDAKKRDDKLPYPVRRIKSKDSLLPISATLPMLSLMKTNQFDSVFHAQWQTLLASVISRKITGYPKQIFVAAHARELLLPPFAGSRGMLSKKLYAIRKDLFKAVDGFFPVSNYTAEILKNNGVSNEKIKVVHNGTDPDFFKPVPAEELIHKHELEDKKIIFSVCRLVERKGMDSVLLALKKLVKSQKDLVYLIGGTGPDKQRLQQMVADLDIQEHVQFLGRIPDDELPQYYSMADVFVMPARNSPPDVEGFGIVFLEANACETPVIGTKTGGIPDAIVNGETGLIVEPDNTGQLVAALSKLINNPKMAHEMGKKGRERVLSEANWDQAANKILKKISE